MKNKKLAITALLLLVVCMLSVSSTISWLTSKSETVVNTFAGGAISITLDEALVSTDGKAVTGDGAKRVTKNTYKYQAGATLDKDPTPTVLKGSEACYVFLCVDNELNEKFTMNYDLDAWKAVGQEGTKTVYAYSTKINAYSSENDIVLKPIFTQVTVANDLTSQEILDLGEKKLSITAYAVQSDSVSAKDAIDMAVAEFLSQGAGATYIDIN